MRRLAIYSTLRAHPWGAPDVLWTRVAAKTLVAGNAVFAVIRPQISERPEVLGVRAAGAEVRLVPELGHGGRKNHLVSLVRNLRTGANRTLSALRAFRPDLVLINQGGFYDFVFEHELLELIARENIPYVVLAHSNREMDVFDPPTRSAAADFIRQAKKFLGISQFILDLGERQLLTRFENTAVFQNPVDLPTCLPLPWPTSSETAFAVVSRLDAHGKGLDILLPAMRTVLGLDSPWRLNVYGDGPDRDYLSELAGATGLADRVKFHGQVVDKAVIWGANHLLLLPSRWEGCSYAMVEALLCGRPVLRTNYGGVAEWLRDGEGGFVCPAPEPQLLAQTLATAWARRADWEAMGRAAHARAAAFLDPQPEESLLDVLDA